MARRRCCGIVAQKPRCKLFCARGSAEEREAVRLCLEEYEAVRRKDYLAQEQAQAAQCMELSRPTFQRVLQSARRKIAQALVEGRTISIEGGNYQMAKRVFECQSCGRIWEEPSCAEGGKHGYEIECPQCGSIEKAKLENGKKHVCAGHAHAGGHGHGGGCCSHHD